VNIEQVAKEIVRGYGLDGVDRECLVDEITKALTALAEEKDSEIERLNEQIKDTPDLQRMGQDVTNEVYESVCAENKALREERQEALKGVKIRGGQITNLKEEISALRKERDAERSVADGYHREIVELESEVSTLRKALKHIADCWKEKKCREIARVALREKEQK
jgi:uncharacterized coiled-coil DUF342 family protein